MPIQTSKLSGVAFSTDFVYESVHLKGGVVMTLGSTASISHGLPYAPYCRVWYNYNNFMFPASFSYASPFQVTFEPKPYILEFQAFPGLFGNFGEAIAIHYRIYKERAV